MKEVESMLPNPIYTNKDGDLSKFKQFVGLNMTLAWDWITLIFVFLTPLALITMLAITHQHLELVIAWVLIIAWLFMLLANVMNCYGVEQYIFTRKVDAKQPDKRGLLYALLGLNIGMFCLIWNNLDDSEKPAFHSPTKLIKAKPKKTKSKKVKKEKK